MKREIIERVMAAGRRALDTGELQTIEWTLESQDEVRHQEGRFMPSGDDEFFLVVRDVTERKQREAQQRALHRVALAVASEARSEQIFDLVAEKIARVLGAHSANLVRFESGGIEAVIVGAWRQPGIDGFSIGERFPLEGTASEIVLKTGRPVRRERSEPDLTPGLAEEMSELDIHSLIAAPITVAGRPWGAVVASLTGDLPFRRASRRG